ncbi:DNA-directed RNA polymerases I and III subunit RPAC2-like isoform X2 [Biomphalaria glabrata]|nr:DNA-directed RNA polymerases I and III subunit RPAC2-like isoform X2 [Biomphalaria glabrata]XP_055895157.1 DNA-directed RNA polymerases I and III subunit RPAC2-like isoform X2 [Biomphalaria glabrata]XP_055895158.1 DNA-directed RNA polymerases I and III subunit RPAC2-like isoform X2 [Biomphalaria glabrata]
MSSANQDQTSKKPILEVLDTKAGSDETVMTFILHDEDHTLGNALKYMLNKNPQVTFVGYSITHPSESKINLRIQTTGVPAVDVLKQAFRDLKKMCSHMLTTFESSTKYFKENHMEETLDSHP